MQVGNREVDKEREKEKEWEISTEARLDKKVFSIQTCNHTSERK